jgi:hypothetical protein
MDSSEVTFMFPTFKTLLPAQEEIFRNFKLHYVVKWARTFARNGYKARSQGMRMAES